MEFRKKTELTEVHQIIGGELDAENLIATESNSYRLENIITVCGMNYCMMTAYETERDPCRKVYRINDKVIIGATGTFDAEENPLDPLLGKDARKLSLEDVSQIVEEYMVSHRDSISITQDRQYILAGQEFDDSFCIVTFDFSPHRKELRRNVFRPHREKIATAISISKSGDIPPTTFYDIYKANLLQCKNVEDVRKYIENAVCAITITGKATPDPLRVTTKAIRVRA